MSPERLKLIAQRGNQKLRAAGKEHRFTSEEAREAVEVRQKRTPHEETGYQGNVEKPRP